MTEEKMTQEIIDLANKWYDGDIQEEEFKKQAENLVKIDRYEQLMLAGVVNRRELLLDFADYSERDKTSETTDECVDNYLDSIK